MRTAKYLFEFERIIFDFIHIFIYTVSFCTMYSNPNRCRYHQYYQYSYPNIEANIFEIRFLKRAARLGSPFLAI